MHNQLKAFLEYSVLSVTRQLLFCCKTCAIKDSTELFRKEEQTLDAICGQGKGKIEGNVVM